MIPSGYFLVLGKSPRQKSLHSSLESEGERIFVMASITRFIRNRSCFVLMTIIGIMALSALYLLKSSNQHQYLAAISMDRLKFLDVNLFNSPVVEKNRILNRQFNLLDDDDPALLSTLVNGNDCSLGNKLIANV